VGTRRRVRGGRDAVAGVSASEQAFHRSPQQKKNRALNKKFIEVKYKALYPPTPGTPPVKSMTIFGYISQFNKGTIESL
jgi:hypothetical protein